MAQSHFPSCHEELVAVTCFKIWDGHRFEESNSKHWDHILFPHVHAESASSDPSVL